MDVRRSVGSARQSRPRRGPALRFTCWLAAGWASACTLVWPSPALAEAPHGESSATVGEQPQAPSEPWLLDLELTGGAPVSSPQRDWYNGGGSLAAGLARPLAPWLALDGRLRTAMFLDGDRPKTPGVKDPDFGTLNSVTFGMVLRLPDGTVRRATGPWVSASIGAALTGKEVRATWEAGLGYGFLLNETMSLGPVLRYLQVVQPDSQLAPSDARFILAGVRLSLFDAREAKPVPTRPDRDSDGDGIADELDRCVDSAEDIDGFADEDGCPEPDNDLDGIPDSSDACPNIPEDKDGFQDEDGCLEDDNDNDGVLDASDQCPLEPETINGETDEDGCPDQGLIEMRDDRVVLQERVLFETNRSRVKQSAEPLLRAIVKLSSQHPEWSKMRIEGHADARGDQHFNEQLSERRASRVREALIELGIKPELLVAQGFGSTHLLSEGTSDEELAKNRRVEFVVIARVPGASAPLLSPATAGAPPVTAPAPAPAATGAPSAPPAPKSSLPAASGVPAAPTGPAPEKKGQKP